MRPFTKRVLPLLFLLAGSVGCSVEVNEKHWKQAEEFSRQGQHLRAIEEYTRVVNLGGRSALASQAQLQIARTYEEQLKDYPRAIRAYRDLYKRADDKNVKLRARWAIARIYAERMENPLVAAEEYAQLYDEQGQFSKEGPEILLAWAHALADGGRFAEAAKRYHSFRDTYPGHKEGPRTLLEEGQVLLADRRPQEALALFREIITRFGKNDAYTALVGEAYYGLGSALEANNELAPALEAYRQGLAMYPNKKVIELKIERVLKRQKEKRL